MLNKLFLGVSVLGVACAAVAGNVTVYNYSSCHCAAVNPAKGQITCDQPSTAYAAQQIDQIKDPNQTPLQPTGNVVGAVTGASAQFPIQTVPNPNGSGTVQGLAVAFPSGLSTGVSSYGAYTGTVDVVEGAYQGHGNLILPIPSSYFHYDTSTKKCSVTMPVSQFEQLAESQTR